MDPFPRVTRSLTLARSWGYHPTPRKPFRTAIPFRGGITPLLCPLQYAHVVRVLQRTHPFRSAHHFTTWPCSTSIGVWPSLRDRQDYLSANANGSAYARQKPPAMISWGNANSASLRWRFPNGGGGERYGLARLWPLAVSMIGRAHRSRPPLTPTTTPVGGFLPPVSPPPYVLSENWKAHLSTPI